MAELIEIKNASTNIVDSFELLDIMHDKPVTSSLRVAEKFNKRHDHILRDIENIIGGIPKTGDTPEMFYKSVYLNKQNGQKYSIYYMDRDGFSLLIMGFKGKKALKWKLDYIKAFNAMEAKLKRLHDVELGRLIERAKSKEVRRSLTDVIRDDYPESPHKKFVYKNFTDLAYKNVFGFNAKQLRNKLGITKKENIRDCFSQNELKQLQEREALIKELVKSGYSYKQVKDILSMKYIDGGTSCSA